MTVLLAAYLVATSPMVEWVGSFTETSCCAASSLTAWNWNTPLNERVWGDVTCEIRATTEAAVHCTFHCLVLCSASQPGPWRCGSEGVRCAHVEMWEHWSVFPHHVRPGGDRHCAKDIV